MPGQSYPETEGHAYSFARAELTLRDKIYTAISAVNADQPTERAAVKGTSPVPLSDTEGTMDLGEGTVTFSDERERIDFITSLGDGFRTVKWGLIWVLRSPSGNEVKYECSGCAVTGNPLAHEEGAEALGGDITFSFLDHKVNGLSPHKFAL